MCTEKESELQTVCDSALTINICAAQHNIIFFRYTPYLHIYIYVYEFIICKMSMYRIPISSVYVRYGQRQSNGPSVECIRKKKFLFMKIVMLVRS